ncbi:MAG: hypothetical protein IKC69_03370, partial [Clostridia bacterium]|nr:hypothetical protein [Clostridia bacterium]
GQAGVDHVNKLKGLAPIEPSSFTVQGKKAEMTVAQVKSATVSCNYVISDLFFTVRDADDHVVSTYTYRTPQANYKTANMNATALAALEKAINDYADATHTLTVEAQISTGEKKLVYTTKLIA